MRRYEVMAILDPAIDERNAAAALDPFLKVIKDGGGMTDVTTVRVHLGDCRRGGTPYRAMARVRDNVRWWEEMWGFDCQTLHCRLATV